MDWLETLLPFILLFIYFLSRLGRQRGQQGNAPPSPTEAPPSAAPPTPFEVLIRQIQEAAEEAQAAQRPAPAAPPKAAPTPRPAPHRRPLAPKVEPEFRPVGGFEHEQHGFGPDNPFSEEAFERLPRGLDVTEHAPGHLGYDPHGLSERPGAAAPKRRHPLAERLRQPDSALEAFAFREILDAPRSRRRR